MVHCNTADLESLFFQVLKVDVNTKPKNNTDKEGKEIITDEKLTTIESLRVMVK